MEAARQLVNSELESKAAQIALEAHYLARQAKRTHITSEDVAIAYSMLSGRRNPVCSKEDVLVHGRCFMPTYSLCSFLLRLETCDYLCRTQRRGLSQRRTCWRRSPPPMLLQLQGPQAACKYGQQGMTAAVRLQPCLLP